MIDSTVIISTLQVRKKADWIALLACASLIFLGLLIAHALFHQRHILVLGAVGIPAVLLLLVEPRAGVVLLLFSLFLSDYLILQGLPRQLTWFSDVVILMLVAFVVFMRIFPGGFVRTGIEMPFFFLLVVGLVAGLKEMSSPLALAVGFRSYLKPILFFLVLMNLEFPLHFYRAMLRLYLLVFMVSMTLSYYQYATSGGGDLATGLLRSSNEVGLVGTAVLCLVLGFSIYCGLKIRHLLLITMIFLAFLCGEIKGAFFLIPAVTLYLFRKSIFSRPSATVALLLVLIFAITASITASTFFSKTDLPRLFLGEGLDHYVSVDLESRELNRWPRLAYAFQYVTKEVDLFLVGLGPGSASPSFFADLDGNQHLIELGIFRSQLSKTVVELGVLGLGSYLLIFSILHRQAQQVLASNADSYWKAVAFGLQGMIFLFIISTVYVDVWHRDALNFLFWMAAAAVCRCKLIQPGYLQS